MKINRHLLILLVAFLPFGSFSQKADNAIILNHLKFLCEDSVARSHKNVDRLQDVAAYLHNDFRKYTDSVTFQPYKVGEKVYTNVIASFGTDNSSRIIVGAHYDVCGNQSGADDNASGTAGLLELARMLEGKKLNFRIDLVAYTLEEPPFFASEAMGSFIHARELRESGVKVEGMICLEMIGYFSDKPNSQDYPIESLSDVYGNVGNFITVVNKLNPGKFAEKFTKSFLKMSPVRAVEFKGPETVTGIDFSDHRNYWSEGFSAVMLTDTAFFRNKNYHKKTDTIETLDLKRMSQVIDGLYLTLIQF